MTQETVVTRQVQREEDEQSLAERVVSLRWYQWAWIGIPVILGFLGGMLGAITMVPAAAINYGLMKSDRFDGPLLYVITGTISFVAFIIYLILALAALAVIEGIG